MQAWMELRGLRPNTLATHRRCAQRFMLGVGKPPDSVKRQDIEHYLLDLTRACRSARTRNVNLAAIRCVLLANAKQDITHGIPQAKVRHRVPEILSGTEVSKLLAATQSLKYRAIFTLAYGAGLRVSEITSLHVADIDSQRILIRVRDGKTGQRYVMMSPLVLAALRGLLERRSTTRPRTVPWTGGQPDEWYAFSKCRRRYPENRDT
jgi:integrase/recombinase XerD